MRVYDELFPQNIILKRPKLAGDVFSQICAFNSLKLLEYSSDSEPLVVSL
jgi:hypothetical protein